jgi:thioredoxin-related protein
MMKKVLVYLLILISPFLFVVFINELTRPEKPFIIELKLDGKPKVEAYNSNMRDPNRCTWNCHNNGCSYYNKFGKLVWNHPEKKSKINKGIISKLYFSIISFNKAPTENGVKGVSYQLMNLIFLVVLWPLIMFVLLILNINQIIRKYD